MTIDFLAEIEVISKRIQRQEDEQIIRENLQALLFDLRSHPQDSENSIVLREKYFAFYSLLREFYNTLYQNSAQQAIKEPINITELCKAIAFSADLLCLQKGYRIFYLGNDEPLYISENEKICIWTILTSISQILEASPSRYIGISTRCFVDSIGICISYSGAQKIEFTQASNLNMPYRALHVHSNLQASKYKAEQSIFLFKSSLHDVAMGRHEKDFINYTDDFLSDFLSPLYIALCNFI